MLNKSVSFALVFALLHVGSGPMLAESQGEVDARLAESVKQVVLMLGVGPKALVEVELPNPGNEPKPVTWQTPFVRVTVVDTDVTGLVIQVPIR